MWPQFPRLENGELHYRLGGWDCERSLCLQHGCSDSDISHFDFLSWDPPPTPLPLAGRVVGGRLRVSTPSKCTG